MNLKTIKLTEIVANPNQPRKHFDEQALQELADSIKSDGLQEPILVRPKGDKYEIVQGERRYRAHKLAGLETIQAKVKEVDDEDAFHLAVIENIQREQLTPIEEARAFQKYVEMGYTHEEIAKKVSKSRTYVTSRLRLLNLIPEIQDMIAEGRISEGHAKQLLKLRNLFPSNNEPFKFGQELFVRDFSSVEKISVKDVQEFSRKIEHSITVSVLNIFFLANENIEDATHWLDLCDAVDVRILEITSEHLDEACQYEIDNLPLPKSGKKSELYKEYGNIHAKYEEIKETLSGLSEDEKVDRWAKKATEIHANRIGQLFETVETSKQDLANTYRQAAEMELELGKEITAEELRQYADKIERMSSDEFIDYYLNKELGKLGVESWEEAAQKVKSLESEM